MTTISFFFLQHRKHNYRSYFSMRCLSTWSPCTEEYYGLKALENSLQQREYYGANPSFYGNHVGGQEQKYFYPLGTKLYSNTNSLKYFYCIHHFHQDHNGPCSPPNFCTTIVFNFSLACSRLLESSLLAEAGTKIKREENWGEKGLFPVTTPLSHITWLYFHVPCTYASSPLSVSLEQANFS